MKIDWPEVKARLQEIHVSVKGTIGEGASSSSSTCFQEPSSPMMGNCPSLKRLSGQSLAEQWSWKRWAKPTDPPRVSNNSLSCLTVSASSNESGEKVFGRLALHAEEEGVDDRAQVDVGEDLGK